MDRRHTDPLVAAPGGGDARAVALRVAPPLAVGLAGAGACVALAIRDPHVAGSWGFCPIFALTGLYCPGCGGLRAVNDLMHLRVLDALHSNAFGVTLIGIAGLCWLAWLIARVRGRPLRLNRYFTSALGWAALGVVVVFTILRNTPWGAWLAPV